MSLERNSIHHAGAIDLLGSLDSDSTALVYADLPYGQTRNEWDMPIDLEAFWSEAWRILTPGGVCALHCQGMFTSDLMRSTPHWRYNLIWLKDRARGHLNANRQPMRWHEDLAVFYRKQPTYNPQYTYGHPPMHQRGTGERKNNNYGSFADDVINDDDACRRHPRSVLEFSCPHPPIHPTEKPVALAEWVIRSYTDPGGLVVDPTCGSGTTAEAAALTGRDFIVGDNSSGWVDFTRTRLAVGRKAAADAIR